jgi:hypothetical protein
LNYRPKISIILPTYNAGSTIKAAAESILNGTFQDLELVVADDGSTDSTLDELACLDDSRLRILNLKHTGVAATANAAARVCRADWIARMDADDISEPHRLESQWEYAQSTNSDLVSGLVRIVVESGAAVEGMQRYEGWLNSLCDHDAIVGQRFVELPIVNPTILARRELFIDRCRQGAFPEDYDHWLGVLGTEGIRVGKVNSVILNWRDHPNRLTRTDERYSPEAFDRCRRMHLQLGPLKGHQTVALWGAGPTGKPWLRWLLKAGFHLPYVVEVSPRKIGKHIHGVEVISPKALPPAEDVSHPLLVAVGAAGARIEIAEFLSSKGYQSGKQIWFVA